MKISTLLAGASVALNVVLAVAFVGQATSPGAGRDTTAPKPATAIAAPIQPKPAEVWAAIQDGDLANQVERLKAEGFPPATVRAIMTAKIRAQFTARRKALDTATPYWEKSNDPKQMLARAALDREEQKILRGLLGPDPETGQAAQVRRMLPGLSDEKIEQVAALRERYQEERNDYYMSRSGIEYDNRKSEELEAAFHARLAAVLSPQELEEYDLREGRTAQQLRYSLAAFDATEQEYRTIFKLQSEFDAKYGSGYRADMSQEEMRARSAAQNQVKEQIKAAFGEARYAEYERGTDTNYRRTTQLVARLNLPPETANEIYALQKDIQKRMTDVRRTAMAGDSASMGPALAALAAEASTALTTKLGSAGFEAYKTNNMGNWLNSLTPPRPAAPKQ